MALKKRVDLKIFSVLWDETHKSPFNSESLGPFNLMSVNDAKQESPTEGTDLHLSHEYTEKGLLSTNIIWELIKNVIAQLSYNCGPLGLGIFALTSSPGDSSVCRIKENNDLHCPSHYCHCT